MIDDGNDKKNIYYALNDYISGGWPKDPPNLVDMTSSNTHLCKVRENGGCLMLLKGSHRLSEIEWKISEARFDPVDDHGRKWACWNHLMRRCEDYYELDYIFIDLNPSGSKLNSLAILR